MVTERDGGNSREVAKQPTRSHSSSNSTRRTSQLDTDQVLGVGN